MSEKDLSPRLTGHLTTFALQLAARRACDFAAFFNGRAPDLSRLKEQQAALFGRSHTLLVRQDWIRLAEQLTELAHVEDEFQEAIASQVEQV
ncbi:MAG: hypothetical protein IT306_01750 [Chloroflexi bacterium]|nr:hypothetical protein [Chloroflexota bacterium]